MRKNEGKVTLKKIPTTRPNIPKNILDNSQINSNIAFDAEFISYINELSSSIKKFYKSSSSNFNQIKTIIHPSDSSNKENETNENQFNNNLLFSFHELENFFSDFYTKAKSIFKKMKNHHNQFTENALNTTSRKNEIIKQNERINSSDNNKKNHNIKIPTTPPKNNIIKKIPKAMSITEENININNKYNKNNYRENNKIFSNKREAKKNKVSTPNKSSYENYINNTVYDNQNNSRFRNSDNTFNNKTISNFPVSNYNKINYSVATSPSVQNIFQYEEKILFLEKECEKYKNNLFDFSNEVNKFLSNLKQFQNNYIIKVPENLRNDFENERNELNNICLNYISSIQNEICNSNNTISILNHPNENNY